MPEYQNERIAERCALKFVEMECVDKKDAPYMSVAVYMLYGCFTLQRKPWRSGDLFASSISNEQQAPN